jgi:hypothetical protein
MVYTIKGYASRAPKEVATAEAVVNDKVEAEVAPALGNAVKGFESTVAEIKNYFSKSKSKKGE